MRTVAIVVVFAFLATALADIPDLQEIAETLFTRKRRQAGLDIDAGEADWKLPSAGIHLDGFGGLENIVPTGFPSLPVQKRQAGVDVDAGNIDWTLPKAGIHVDGLGGLEKLVPTGLPDLSGNIPTSLPNFNGVIPTGVPSLDSIPIRKRQAGIDVDAGEANWKLPKAGIHLDGLGGLESIVPTGLPGLSSLSGLISTGLPSLDSVVPQ